MGETSQEGPPLESHGELTARESHGGLSPQEKLALLRHASSPMQELAILLGPEGIAEQLTPEEQFALRYAWQLWARKLERMPDPPKPRKAPGYGVWRGQLAPPGPWTYCVFCGGRGAGKTRAGAEWVIAKAKALPENSRIAIVGATAGDTWGTLVEGESGILACSPPWFRPDVQTSKRRLLWPNGVIGSLFSADEPGRFRGPNNAAAWADELPEWRRKESWHQLQFTMRAGDLPQTFVSCNPSPTRVLLDLVESPNTALVVGTSYDNKACLAAPYFDAVIKPYLGTAKGRVEIMGEILTSAIGALFEREWFLKVPKEPRLSRVVIGIDPAETSGPQADEWGIVVAGKGEDGLCYILEDASLRNTPDVCVRRAVKAARDWGAPSVVCDVGRGGELLTGLVRMADPGLRVVIKGGNRGKRAWAEQVSVLYERGRMRHLQRLDTLEDQLVTWTDEADWSPDRMDALVYAVCDLMVTQPVKQSGLNDGRTAMPRRM